jgi:phosphoribosylamine--glycine ligase
VNNLLVIGSGGREHALCWALKKSPKVHKLYCAPGNGGIRDVADCITLDVNNHKAVIDFCRAHDIALVVVGPEGPLVAGIVDALEAAGIKAFGPSAAAAQLEGSKGFTKDLCARHHIPTAGYIRTSDAKTAREFVRKGQLPIVIKADGLAAGKGVIIAETLSDADSAIDAILGGQFGAAGAELVVEEFLEGEEASFFALVDGTNILPLASAQDHKRVGDGDTGPNTGGMGAYSPAPVMTAKVTDRVMNEIIRPTVAGMTAAGTPFKGVLFAGLMITEDGPKLIEYNTRFGDPECQVLMMRLKSDLLDVLMATAAGKLDGLSLDWDPRPALTVVMAAKGYPGDYGDTKGSVIANLDEASALEDVQIFHAGTVYDQGQTLANGGRVLNITALGETVSEAQAKAYAAIDKIRWPEGFYRKDIGQRAIEREQSAS